MTTKPIVDRRVPTDFTHVEKYPATGLRQLQRSVPTVERVLKLPLRYHAIYDQGAEGACVGFGESILMSILNRKLYDARWLYQQAQLIDEWADTPPAGGTSLRAGFDVLRDRGHRRLYAARSRAEEMDEGIVDVNRWLTTVDEARTAIASWMPVCLGINWYDRFYEPTARQSSVSRKPDYWIAEPDGYWGPVVGGHCITLVGASDRRQAFALYNSWGTSYPWPTWLPYTSFARLMSEYGEAAIVTDK